MTPVNPTAFFTSNEAVMTVSVASENTRPTTGTKLPVIYFAVFSATPSVTELVTPCTEITPRNTVNKTPNNPTLRFLSRLAS